ncbi:hypothetical protein BD779DRAFT_1438826, partial [Infundibulicybe gibba]
SGGIFVHWPVGNATWKPSGPGVEAATGVSRYKLVRTPGSPWDYRLDFTNVWGWFFVFADESGDDYQVNALVKGDHYVRYNSDKPTIVYVA